MIDWILFYGEWLHLPKADFRILTMLAANHGSYSGTLTDMCSYLNETAQSKNRKCIKKSILSLADGGYLHSETKGHTYSLQVTPKATEIKVMAGFVESVMRHDYSTESVAPENVLKMYLWTCYNNEQLTTNAIISEDLGISESTICAAKNVLEKEYDSLYRKRVSEKVTENFFIYKGQFLQPNILWTQPPK